MLTKFNGYSQNVKYTYKTNAHYYANALQEAKDKAFVGILIVKHTYNLQKLIFEFVLFLILRLFKSMCSVLSNLVVFQVYKIQINRYHNLPQFVCTCDVYDCMCTHTNAHNMNKLSTSCGSSLQYHETNSHLVHKSFAHLYVSAISLASTAYTQHS